jgi:hypothetical protein
VVAGEEGVKTTEIKKIGTIVLVKREGGGIKTTKIKLH